MTMQTKRKFTARKWLAAMLCLTIALMTTHLTAWAVNLEQGSASLTVSIAGDVFDYYDDLTGKANVVVDLYKLANVKAVDVYDTYVFDFSGGYGDIEIGGVKMSDLVSGQVSLTGDQWKALSQIIAGRLQKSDSIPYAKEFRSVPLGTEGAYFANLNPGLYLVVPHNANDSDYWETKENKDANEKSIVSVAESDNYSYFFSPSIVSLPTKTDLDADGVITTAPSDGPWVYDATVDLKASVEPRYGSIQITKQIDQFSGNEEVTFVFEVSADGTFGQEKYHYSTTASVAFNQATGTSATVTVDHIRAGAQVQVKEVYDGLRYHGDNLNTWQAPQLVKADSTGATPVTFTFTNTFDNDHSGGHGIQNHFEFGRRAGETQDYWFNTQQTAGSGLYD